jgi:hypothetical protein
MVRLGWRRHDDGIDLGIGDEPCEILDPAHRGGRSVESGERMRIGVADRGEHRAAQSS